MANERRFPIHSDSRQTPGCPATVPWSFVETHRQRAEENHSQTLERLAERGGLALGELYCVVNELPLHAIQHSAKYERDAWLPWLMQALHEPRDLAVAQAQLAVVRAWIANRRGVYDGPMWEQLAAAMDEAAEKARNG